MFEKLILYSPIIIFVLFYILKFFWLRFAIFVDELISGYKIKCFSNILFFSTFIYIFWVCHKYKISLFKFNSNDLDLVSLLSLVLTIFASYGVYVGFLQFMAGYDNKENGTYLGYNKMDFLTKSNVWYHLTYSKKFFFSLLLVIVIPIIFKVEVNSKYSIFYQYGWQAIVGFLLILFIFLLKFSLKVAKITIFINKKSDVGLKEVIKSDIKNRYKRYYNILVKKNFLLEDRKWYFLQIKSDLSKIDSMEDKITFLKIVYSSISRPDIPKNVKFKCYYIDNYKSFIKEKYDLIADSGIESDEFISFVISLFNEDIQDKLIKDNEHLLDDYKNLQSLGLSNKKTILGLEYNEKIRKQYNHLYENKRIQIDNIHDYIFEIILKITNNKKDIVKLVSLAQDIVSRNNIIANYWETNIKEELFVFEKSNSTSNIRISKENFIRIRKMDVFYFRDCNLIEHTLDNYYVYISIHSNIVKIDFHFKDGRQYYIKRNEIKDHYNGYEEKVWNILFDKYIDSDDLSDALLPNLREPKIISYSFGGCDEPIIQDYDNKIAYSKLCFKYLTDNYDYVDGSTSNFTNLLEIIKTMSIKYQGAFALYQLLNNQDVIKWDSSFQNYVEILLEILSSRREERDKIYNDMVSIITEIEYDNSLVLGVLGKVFETRDVELIDDDFLKDFKDISKLNLIVIQNIFSSNRYLSRRVELKEDQEKRNLLNQYIRALSVTPNLFPIYTYDNKTLNSTMSEFLLKNIELLTSYDFEKLPLSSILLFEKLLRRELSSDQKLDEQEFMINLIKVKASFYKYSIYGSLLKFFTLKLTGCQGNKYLRIVNDKNFKKEFKFSLLEHLKKNKLTLDMYLDGIYDELKNHDSLMIGIYEKELIKREIEKIIFQSNSIIKMRKRDYILNKRNRI